MSSSDKIEYIKGSYEYVMNNFELNLEQLDDVDTERIGSYKLSAAIINRMLGKYIKVKDKGKKKTIPNVTNSEIILLIFLSQICSARGKITELNYNEIKSSTNLSTKSIYNALDGLVEKQYIKKEKLHKGYYDITILDNEFTTTSDDKKTYVNTNREEFLIINKTEYDKFSSLSLQEKKLYLMLLLRYNHQYGYTKTLDSFKSELDVKNYSRIHKYINNIAGLIGNENLEVKGKTSYLKKITYYFKAKNLKLYPNEKVHSEQLTFFKRKILKFIEHNNIIFREEYGYKQSTYLDMIYNIIDTNKNLGISNVFKYIQYIFLNHTIIGPSELMMIRHGLKIATN